MGVQEKQQLWGGETTKAVANFPISGEPIPVPVIRWLGRIKAAAARVNAELGLLDAGRASASPPAADRVAERRVRRPVPDRRLPDRLGHLLEHERQRGDRQPAPARAPTPTTTSTWASPPTTCSRPLSISPRSTRPATTCCRRSTRSRRSLQAKADEFHGHRQGGPHAPDGRGAGHARPGVLGLCRAGTAGRAASRATRCRRSRRSRSAAPPPAPGSTPIRSSPTRVRAQLI